MREQFSLPFDNVLIEQLLNSTITIAQFLEQLFGDQANDSYQLMCQKLQDYQSRDEGSPEVKDFAITDPVFKADELSGSFKCRFIVHRFYTCSAIHNQAKDVITWDFKVDASLKMLMFTGEKPWIQVTE